MDDRQLRAPYTDTVTDLASRLEEHVKEHPYATLAAAAGVGYLLAGGLFTRLTARVLKTAIAAAAPLIVAPLVENEIERLADGVRARRAAATKPVRGPAATSNAATPTRATREA